MCSFLWTTRGSALAALALFLSYLSVSSAFHGGNSSRSSKNNAPENVWVATCDELRQAVEQNRSGRGHVSGTTPPKLLVTITADSLMCSSFHAFVVTENQHVTIAAPPVASTKSLHPQHRAQERVVVRFQEIPGWTTILIDNRGGRLQLEGLVEFEILPPPGDASPARMNELPVADNGVLRLRTDGSIAGSTHNSQSGSFIPAFGSLSTWENESRRLEDIYDEDQLDTFATPSPVAATDVTEETSDTNSAMYSSPSPVAMPEVETPADSTTPSPSLGELENPENDYPTPSPVEQPEGSDSNPTTSAETADNDYSTPTPVEEDGAYLTPTASPLASEENVATTSPNPLLGEPGEPEETPTASPTLSPLEMPSTEDLTYPSPFPTEAVEEPEPHSSYPSTTSSPDGASSTPERNDTANYTISPTPAPLPVPTPAPLAVPTPAPLTVPTPWPTWLSGEGEYGGYGSSEGEGETYYSGDDDFAEESQREGYYRSQESTANDETWYEGESDMGYDDFDGGEGYVDGERSSSSAAAAGSHGAGAYGDEEKDPAVDDNTYVFEVAAGMLAAVALLGLGAFMIRRRRQRTLRGEFRNVPHHGLGNADNL